MEWPTFLSMRQSHGMTLFTRRVGRCRILNEVPPPMGIGSGRASRARTSLQRVGRAGVGALRRRLGSCARASCRGSRRWSNPRAHAAPAVAARWCASGRIASSDISSAMRGMNSALRSAAPLVIVFIGYPCPVDGNPDPGAKLSMDVAEGQTRTSSFPARRECLDTCLVHPLVAIGSPRRPANTVLMIAAW